MYVVIKMFMMNLEYNNIKFSEALKAIKKVKF